MKKAISLFLALSVLCFATSAMAATNSINTVDNAPRNGVTEFGSAYNSASMPCFRPNDTLSFNLSALTVSNELTVISYKYNETLSDSTVQYINQYTVDSASETIDYTIRNLDSGVYVLKFNDDANEVATFYYKVGKATAVLIESQNGNPVSSGTYGNPYRSVEVSTGNWSIGFIGKITVDSADVSLADIGARPGFTVKDTSGHSTNSRFGDAGQKSVANLDDTRIELSSGASYSFIYGLTMYNVTTAQKDNITATALLDTPSNN